MATEIINDVPYEYAPNPKMQGEIWATEYPPIKHNGKWLVNKYTGELFPNTPEFARRSDILAPYTGEVTTDSESLREAKSINDMLARGDESGLSAL